MLGHDSLAKYGCGFAPALFAAVLLFSAPFTALATKLTVTTVADSGTGSLRRALLDAGDGDTITFSVPAHSVISLTSGELVVDKSLTITGPGANLLTVQRSTATGTPAFGIFNVAGAASIDVTISGLTISGGSATGADGGGIASSTDLGSLTVSGCVVTGNVTDGRGGGLFNDGGTVTVTKCTFSSNSGPSGAGIYANFGVLTVTDTTISGNSAGSNGGGIYCNFGTVFLRGCTVSGNSAANSSGGFYCHSSELQAINSTFSGNTAGVDAGGILNDDGGEMVLTYCTVTANSAATVGGIDTSQGDGFELVDTIIAGNKDTSGNPDGLGSFSSDGYNIIGVGTGINVSATTGDKIGTAASPIDPLLSPLQDNGGPTFTHALLFGSPAIDKGAPANDPSTGDPITTDERGMTRPVDRPSIANAAGGDASDIGAFEVQTPSLLLNISTRLNVLTGNNVLIGGFIVTGTAPKKVLLRGIGPSLAGAMPPVANPLANPVLELHTTVGKVDTLVASNDDWKDTQKAAIIATGIPPTNDLESAIVAKLDPGNYTVILSGKNGGTGVALVEAYDLNPAVASQLANISTRGLVSTGDNVMIAGYIVGEGGGGGATVLVRAIGPSLAKEGVTGALANPTLDLNDANGNVIATNDDWKDTQQPEIKATGIPPTSELESAIEDFVLPGNYTAIVRGVNNTTGIALGEVYNLN
ncbi:MAG: choice-of-anchor Q domain-containing protein [Bryobacteraceae bacterium]